MYKTTGSSADWALGPRPNGAGIKYVYGMELRPTQDDRNGFALPPEQIIPTGQEVWAFHLSIAKHLIDEFSNQNNSYEQPYQHGSPIFG